MQWSIASLTRRAVSFSLGLALFSKETLIARSLAIQSKILLDSLCAAKNMRNASTHTAFMILFIGKKDLQL